METEEDVREESLIRIISLQERTQSCMRVCIVSIERAYEATFALFQDCSGWYCAWEVLHWFQISIYYRT